MVVFGPLSRAFADDVALHACVIRHVSLADQDMSGFDTEMRDVDNGGRIIRQNGQRFTAHKALQPFARFQNRQRAKKPGRVEYMRIFHVAHIGAMFHPVHAHVTARPGDVGVKAG